MAVILDGQWRVAQGMDESQPGGVLLAGMSGTGKTMTSRMMCKHLGVPYAEVDATRFAEVSFKGMQLPQMFIPLMREAARMKDAEAPPEEPDAFLPPWAPKTEKGAADELFKREDIDEIVERAQTGVILLDEFDKWVQRFNHVTGQPDTAIQGELLKMIEGSHEFVTATDEEIGVPFDTSKVLIICAGAFVGLYRQVRIRLHEDSDARIEMDENFWNSIVPEDFERYGLLPELAGRLSRHIFTRNLQPHHLLDILTRPAGPLAYYRNYYESLGVTWDIGSDGINYLVQEASHHKTGARALDHVAHKMLGGELLYEAATADMAMAVRLKPNDHRARIEPL